MQHIDVTKIRQMREEAERRQAELLHVSRSSTPGEMASGFAHELNQPLRANLERIVNQSARAGEIMRRVRAFVQRRQPCFGPVEVNKAIRDTLGLLDSDLRHRQVRAILDLPEDLPPVLADSIQLEPVLLNLVRNAGEAMEAVDAQQQRLTLRTSVRADDTVQVVVSDTGPGIPPEMIAAKTFTTAQEFLDAFDPSQAGCLVLDVRLPGMSGLRLQDELITRGITLPIIFISGHGDLPMAVEAMKKGAYDFLEKPVGDQMLLDRLNAALAEDRRRHESRMEVAVLQRKPALLTPREREVLQLLRLGRSTGKIARALDISQKTAQVHRTHILEKMEADTVTNLVTLLHQYNAAQALPPPV
ncbi:MAG: response regulator [Phycisphaerales bacterium]